MKPLPAHFLSKVTVQPNGCWIWHGTRASTGYGLYWTKQQHHRYDAHRIAYQFTHGKIPTGMCVLHRCDVRSCVNPSHLFLGTHQDNVADMVQKGRQAKGDSCTMRKYADRFRNDNHPRSILTVAIVQRIRKLYKAGIPINTLATRYGVHRSTIDKAIRGTNWKHFPPTQGETNV